MLWASHNEITKQSTWVGLSYLQNRSTSNEIKLPKTTKKVWICHELCVIDGTVVSECAQRVSHQHVRKTYTDFLNTNYVLQIKTRMFKSNSLVNKQCLNTFWQSLCCLISIQRANKPKSPIYYSPQHTPFGTFSPLGYVVCGLCYFSFSSEILDRCRAFETVKTNM